MGTAAVVFLVIGGLGVLLLLFSLLGGELLDLGDSPVGVEAASGFLAAFGFAGAIAAAALDARTPLPLLASAGIGLAAAVPAAWLAGRIVRAAGNMPTDATPTDADLVGVLGVVVTPIPAQGYGEVRVTLGGQPVKVSARADSPIPLGTQIMVISALSDTSVVVEETPSVH
jgi:membrane protein implicated in regulation of membrane protease activity